MKTPFFPWRDALRRDTQARRHQAFALAISQAGGTKRNPVQLVRVAQVMGVAKSTLYEPQWSPLVLMYRKMGVVSSPA